MHTGLLHLHSFLRYVLLILLLAAIVNACKQWLQNKAFEKKDNALSLWVMIVTHIQLLVGIGLYLVSPIVTSGLTDMGEAMKAASTRFWVIEHPVLMLLSIVLITLGRILSKKAERNVVKHRRVAIFFLIGLVVMFFAIPWPFMREIFEGRGFF